jgi:hypothetical protein
VLRCYSVGTGLGVSGTVSDDDKMRVDDNSRLVDQSLSLYLSLSLFSLTHSLTLSVIALSLSRYLSLSSGDIVSTYKQRGSKPDPSKGIVRLDGDMFSQALELWGFLSTFSQPLKVLTLPSIAHLAGALRACDVSYKKLRGNTKGTFCFYFPYITCASDPLRSQSVFTVVTFIA